MLASVQAIIGLTAQNAPSQEEFTKRLQGRVSALARTHALLTGEKWRGASLTRIIRDELQPYVEGDEEQVLLTGHPDCILPPRQALDLALMAHELATNAVKYGALSAADGKITIDWHIDGEGEDTHLALTWQETGGPSVEQPSHRGFGTRLLEKVLGKTADSNLQLDFLPEGVRCHLVMRLRGQEASTDDEVLHQTQPQQQQQEIGALLPSPAAVRVLVAEDEHLAALELATILTDAGLHVVGPASTVREAMQLARGAAIAAGVFDVNLNGEMIFPVADLLIARGAPVVLVTGYDTDNPLPDRYRGLGVLRKPVDRDLLMKRLHTLLTPHKAAGDG
jgi:two-component sensor histidine kinase/CheY-like chemotaxis protein